MRLLLDTHTVLWFLGGDERLGGSARRLIEDPRNDLLFSTAGAWEIAIKVGLGKLSLRAPFEEIIPGDLNANAIHLLPILPDHMREVMDLPFHHRDPFDRMMIAQAVCENATLLSADATLDAYGVTRIWQ